MNVFQELAAQSDTIAAPSEEAAPFSVPRMEPIKPAAEISNMPVHALRMMVANGDVVSVRVGRKILVNMDSLIAFLNTGIPQGSASRQAAPQAETVPRVTPIPLR